MGCVGCELQGHGGRCVDSRKAEARAAMESSMRCRRALTSSNLCMLRGHQLQFLGDKDDTHFLETSDGRFCGCEYVHVCQPFNITDFPLVVVVLMN